MFDIRFIRENPETFDTALARRNVEPQSAVILELDEKRRSIQTRMQDVQASRKTASKEIGALKASGQDADEQVRKVAEMKNMLAMLEADEKLLASQLKDALSSLPNILDDAVPQGADEDDNVEIHRWGEPTVRENAEDHVTIGEKLGMMRFDIAAKLSGARFVWLDGPLARLERALAQFMLDTQTDEHGYTEVAPPFLVNDAALYGTGQLPKFAEDLFKTTTDHWLIPTSEVPLTNSVAGEIADAEKLPLRLTAFTPCFRSEAGSAGKDTRGMIRVHQFHKVEMVSITSPEKSKEEHERMLGCAETILKKLDLPFRTIVLCSGDTGFTAQKTYDIEVWVPSQDTYREISSVSNCGDFQARRMNARFRGKGEKDTQFLHTLNGSGLAVGRTLVAVIENYYNPEDNTLTIPEVLRPYMGGKEKIEARS